MSSRPKITRRGFLKTSLAAMAAPAIIPATSLGKDGATAPSDRITMGLIGIGKQGEGHVRALSRNANVQVLAICDVYKKFADLGIKYVTDAYASNKPDGKYRGVQGYVDYRELIARDDIDAVLIAVPDHQHAIVAILAARSGKDIYCEKPLSLTISEARAMVNAVRNYGRVFQTGSQQRSSREFLIACQLVRNGYIGRIKEVFVGVGVSSQPCDLPGQPIPEGLDWDRWLGPAPYRPFNEVLRPNHNRSFPNWRAYRDYSGGAMTDFGAHHFDIAQWGLGMDATGPVEVVPPNGKDVQYLTYRYANGIPMYRGGPPAVTFVGTEGEVYVDRGKLTTKPDYLAQMPFKVSDIHLYKSPGHHQDWINCIRSRNLPICDVEIGCRTASVCHIGNIACWLNRPLKWDPVKEVFPGDDEANRWLSRAYREPYVL